MDAPASSAPTSRLEWLDALRGIGALAAMLSHVMAYVLKDLRSELLDGFVHVGRYGVVLFFVVSGYVIPLSLERSRSLRRFWVGRVFRVYPALLLSALMMAGFFATGVLPVPATLREEPLTATLGHVVLMQDMLGLPSMLITYWTLTFEMLFYLLVSALFVFRMNRMAVWIAPGLALVGLLAGPLLPGQLLIPDPTRRFVVTVVVFAAMVCSVAAYLSGKRKAAVMAAMVGGAFFLLPLMNANVPPGSALVGSWVALLMLAAMFAGTVVYHAQHRVIRPRTAMLSLVVVVLAMMTAFWAHLPSVFRDAKRLSINQGNEIGAVVAVAATFGIAFLLRHRRIPRFLAWLGTVSYSVYLLHQPVVYLFRYVLVPDGSRRTLAEQALIAGGIVAVTLAVSWASYRLVEKGGQTMGRHVAALLDRRLGRERSAPEYGSVRVVPDRGRRRRVAGVRRLSDTGTAGTVSPRGPSNQRKMSVDTC
ncbi:acyltransferase family protein [Couchioplanes azureus]|nr:acyltransferase [Couchioplanes caeruleus]